LIFHIWKDDTPIIYMKDSEIGPVPQACLIPQTSPIILWRQISTWESKNKPDSIVMSNSPKHVRFGPTNVPDFTKKQCYPSIWCMFTILSVFQYYYYTIKPRYKWVKSRIFRETKSCTNRVGVSVRIRVRVRVRVWVSVTYYVIKVVPESFRIRVFPLNGPMSVEYIRGHVWHRYDIAVNQVVVATEKLSKRWPMSTHPPNLFAHKERIWYDYICPKEKEEKTQTTSRHEIIKRE
jgi:hypothetical protein